MHSAIPKGNLLKKLTKSATYARIRRYFPMPDFHYIGDDMERLASAEKVLIDWPSGIRKPVFAIIKDYEFFPRWTKNARFLENNSFSYEIFNLHAHDWLERARNFDIFVGFTSNELFHVQEMRKKYFALETYLRKTCYPSTRHILLYEDKTLESYISEACGLPYAKTHISHEKNDALDMIQHLAYPVIHKIDPGSGSLGVELVRDISQARKIVNQAFSISGRATHSLYFRQKSYVYFQDFIPNDGYDIRVEIVGNWAFGYYRRVLEGDFRASGMDMVEKRDLPEEAIHIALRFNQVIQSPMLVVDMVHGLDGQFQVIEFSPICQMEKPEQLHVNGVPGAYVIGEDNQIHFIAGKFWVHELAMREFLQHDYLPKCSS